MFSDKTVWDIYNDTYRTEPDCGERGADLRGRR